MTDRTTDREAFRRLYESYSTRILAYCFRRIGPDLAHDALAETFLVAWRRFNELPTGDETLPYLYGIAAKVLSNSRRSSRRRTRLDSRLQSLGVDHSADASTYVLQSDQNRRVLDAIQQLGKRDREILMLYTWEEVPREKIADMMGMTKSAIDQRIHRSYKRLARTFGSTGVEPTSLPRVAKKGGEA